MLEELRANINQIDDELARLFVERMYTAAEVAQYKRDHGLPVFQPEREREVLARLTEGQPEDIAHCIAQLYEAIFAISKNYQKDRL